MTNPLKSPSGARVREATLADAPLLAELGAQTFAETFADQNSAEDMAAYLASAFSSDLQAAELSDPNFVSFVVAVEGVPAGYAQIRSDSSPTICRGKKSMELVRLYVAQAWLGCGLGALLMKTCIDESRKRGFDCMWLGVWERNIRARAFYEQWGFYEVGEHVFQLGRDAQRDLILERAL